MAARKKPVMQKYTLPEFRAWLAGIEEIQPSNWSPDANQWKMIRQKIDNIVETVIKEKVQVPVQPRVAPQPMPQVAPSAFQPQNDGWQAPTPPQPSAVPAMTPAAQAALSGKLPKEMVPDVDGKIKTSNIDTSQKPYESNFG